MIDERDIEGKLVREVQERGGLCLKLDSSTKKGVQDRMLLLPRGRVFFVELKKPGGRVSVVQKVRQTQLKRLGFDTRVVRNTAEVDNLIAEIDNETLKE